MSESKEALPPVFDAAKAWDGLTVEQQRDIGMAALMIGCAWAGMDTGMEATRLGDLCDNAVSQLTDVLEGEYKLIAGDAAQRPDLNQIGIRACTACGCTDDHACVMGCYWIGPTLCSSCEGLGT